MSWLVKLLRLRCVGRGIIFAGHTGTVMPLASLLVGVKKVPPLNQIESRCAVLNQEHHPLAAKPGQSLQVHFHLRNRL